MASFSSIYFIFPSILHLRRPDCACALCYTSQTSTQKPKRQIFQSKTTIADKDLHSVCFYESHHEELKARAEERSSIKLPEIKRKMNFYNPSEEDIEITKYTKIEKADEIPAFIVKARNRISCQ